MQKTKMEITRRGFVAGVLGTTVAAALGRPKAEAAPARARVVKVVADGIWKGDARNADVVAAMVNQGVVSLTQTARPSEAWKQFFTAGQRVGLKINLLGRPLVFTAREVTWAVAGGALSAGIRPDDLIVWDRKPQHFGPDTYQPGRGPHGERILTGGSYSATTATTTSGAAPMDRIPLEMTDVTVNLPVMKDHGMAGVTFALKNIAFGCYANQRSAHSGNCEPFITETCSHFYATTKVPLIVLDSTEGCFDGGPSPGNPDVVWREGAIYFATDPVAMDVVAREVLMAKRRAVGLHDKTGQCRHIENAAAKGLGIGDRALIDVVTVKV